MFSLTGNLVARINVSDRRVEGNIITSQRDPKVQIRLPKSAQYAGTDRWLLYGIADCELHAFVEADRQRNVQRLYWVQFEGYVPTMPKLKHEYDSLRHAKVGGMDFYVDTWVRSSNARTRPKDLQHLEAFIRAEGYAVPAGIRSGSDEEHLHRLIRAKGYRMPEGMMYVRLVHLLDQTNRKELMIIYGENAVSAGLTVSQLGRGGGAFNRWPAIERGLIERAKEKIAISTF